MVVVDVDDDVTVGDVVVPGDVLFCIDPEVVCCGDDDTDWLGTDDDDEDFRVAK